MKFLTITLVVLAFTGIINLNGADVDAMKTGNAIKVAGVTVVSGESIC